MQVTATLVVVFILGSAQLPAVDTAAAGPSADVPPCDAPRLSQASAIRIALADLKRRKIDTSGLDAPSATCSVTDKGKTWSVYFQSKAAVEDGCFWVLIDDRSGKVNPVYGACG